DLSTYQLVANILVDNRPRRFALSPDASTLWVTNELGGTVSLIDTQADEIVNTLTFEPEGFRPEDVTPVGLLFDDERSRVYVTMGRANHVAVVDAETLEVLDYILVGSRA